MFCPNCGTQNPDAAPTCSKCSFNLKGASAPKFKGTMLMMNQPGAQPAAPAAPPVAVPPALDRPPGAGAPPPPPGPGNARSKLKGTMVGVAPMAGGVPASPGGESPASYSPPGAQPEVNPLGGTLVADAGAFGSYSVQGQGAAPHGDAEAPARAGGVPPTSPAFPVPKPPQVAGANEHGGVDPFASPQLAQGHVQSAPIEPVKQEAPSSYVPPGAPMRGTLMSEGARIAAGFGGGTRLPVIVGVAIMGVGMLLSIVLAFAVSPWLWAVALLFGLGGGVFYMAR